MTPQATKLQSILQIAKADIEKLKSPEGWLYASLDRYECFFSRDAITSSLALLATDPTIAKATLLKLQATQGKEFNYEREEEKGRVVHEYRVKKDAHYYELVERGMGFPFYGTSDGTLLYIYLAEEYIKHTKDAQIAQTIAQSLYDALEWILSKTDELGFVRVPQINRKGALKQLMVNQSWLDNPKALSYKDGSLPIDDNANYPVAYLEIQGYFIALANGIDYIKDALDTIDPTIVQRVKDAAVKTQANLDSYFYIPEEDFYAPAIDNRNRRFDIVTSVPGYLLFVHAATQLQAERINKRFLQADILTNFGIRTLSTQAIQFNMYSYQQGAVWPHDNWIIAAGLKDYGFTKEAESLKHAVQEAVFRLGTIPELYNVSLDNHLFLTDSFDVSVTDNAPLMSATGMKVQAWSCAAIIAFNEDNNS